MVGVFYFFTAKKYRQSLDFNILASGAPGYPRPGLIPGRDGPLGLHHPDLLGRPYADQLAHQVNL